VGIWSKLLGTDRARPPGAIPMAEFRPENPLEELVRSVIGNTLSGQDFLERVIVNQLQLFVPSLSSDSTATGGIEFMIVEAGSMGRMVAVFTSPSRHVRVQAQLPRASSGILVESRWVFENAPRGVGLVINPGWEACIPITHVVMAQLRGEIPTGPLS
jgi:hypothetical protein